MLTTSCDGNWSISPTVAITYKLREDVTGEGEGKGRNSGVGRWGGGEGRGGGEREIEGRVVEG